MQLLSLTTTKRCDFVSSKLCAAVVDTFAAAGQANVGRTPEARNAAKVHEVSSRDGLFQRKDQLGDGSYRM
jgi:hypothetical protein